MPAARPTSRERAARALARLAFARFEGTPQASPRQASRSSLPRCGATGAPASPLATHRTAEGRLARRPTPRPVFSRRPSRAARNGPGVRIGGPSPSLRRSGVRERVDRGRRASPATASRATALQSSNRRRRAHPPDMLVCTCSIIHVLFAMAPDARAARRTRRRAAVDDRSRARRRLRSRPRRLPRTAAPQAQIELWPDTRTRGSASILNGSPSASRLPRRPVRPFGPPRRQPSPPRCRTSPPASFTIVNTRRCARDGAALSASRAADTVESSELDCLYSRARGRGRDIDDQREGRGHGEARVEVLRVKRDFGKPHFDLAIDAWLDADATRLDEARLVGQHRRAGPPQAARADGRAHGQAALPPGLEPLC